MSKKNNNVLLADSEKIEKVVDDYLARDDISIDDNVFIHARLTRVTTVIVYK